MRIVFVSYGWFGNNSSYHIEGFARQLLELGHEIGIVAAGNVDGERSAYCASPQQIEAGTAPAKLQAMLDDPQTILHAWTPRETVRRIVEPLARRGLRYIVHLEDDERLVAATQLGLRGTDLDNVRLLPREFPGHVSHPERSQAFLRGAAAVTVIVKTLFRDLPANLPAYLVEPGVDAEFFRPKLLAAERHILRRRLGIRDDALVVVYNGNSHPAIERDLFSLYSAIRILRRQGIDIYLLRTGERDHITRRCDSYYARSGIIDLDYIPRSEMPTTLELSDLLVQPGSPNPFNTSRLPSKILEFLAMSRPVVLPHANLGLMLVDGVEAFILRESGPLAIVNAVLNIKANPRTALSVGQKGREFVIRNFEWASKARILADIYDNIGLRRPPTSGLAGQVLRP